MSLPVTLDRPKRAALTVVLCYVAIAAAWIWLSDGALSRLIEDPGQNQLLQTAKGWFFVLVTAAGLFLVLNRQWARFERGPLRLLEAAVEAAGEAVLITDAEGTIQYVNPAFERITGYRADEVRGGNPRLLKSGQQSHGFYRRMWDRLTAGGTFQGEFVNRRKDGRLYRQEATITPIRDETGRTTHYVQVARDVTEARRLQRQLQEAQKVEALGRASAAVAHDSRNVLGVIQAHTDLALQAVEEGRSPGEELAEIVGAVQHGTRLLKGLLSLGRRGELEFRVVSLSELVLDMGSTLRAIFPDSVAIELDPGEALVVRADPGSVFQMVLNLATNARDAMPQGGAFRVCIGRHRGLRADAAPVTAEWIEVEVSDTGTGMDESVRNRVFEPLFTTKPPDRGTGLGLSIVQRLIDAHGGCVAVESELGKGTTVRLFFPPAKECAPSANGQTEQVVAPELPGGTETVLAVDDEEPLRRGLARSLEKLGYRVLTAEHGKSALEILDTERVDLVVTDLVMPEMGGRRLHEEMMLGGLGDIPIVFMSGYQVADADGELPGSARRNFLEKPWTLEELARTLREALSHSVPMT